MKFQTLISSLLAMSFAASLPVHAGPDKALLAASTTESGALVATLEKLVRIESGSRDAAGLAALAGLLESELKALGMQVRRDAGGNVVGSMQGKGGSHVLLMAHMDTVYPAGALAGAPFRIEGARAYGPGVADAKGGIALILHAVKLLRTAQWRDIGSLTVLFNNDEETGSQASQALIQSLAAQADYVLSFEPNMAGQEGFTLGTSGVANVTVDIQGKAAHAGMAPEAGVNALVEAADLVERTAGLDDRAAGLRFNWTGMQAGAAANVIPDRARMSADLRFATNEQADAAIGELEQLAQRKKLAASEVKLTVQRGRPAFNAGAAGRTLTEEAASIYAEAGGRIAIVPRVGGGTDAAFAALSGKPVLEGLGLPGAGIHGSAAEYVDLDAVPRRLYLAVRLIRDLGRRR